MLVRSLRSAPVALAALLTLSAAMLGAACSDAGESSTCVDTLCSPGDSVCDEGFLRTCNTAGDGYVFQPPGPAQYCAAGAIQDGTCAIDTKGCLTDSSYTVCTSQGSSETFDCGAGELCVGNSGVCVTAACTDGDSACGVSSALTCVAGVWTETACDGDQICQEVAGSATCVDQICTPLTARCDGNTSHVCDRLGTSETEEACGATGTCKNGFCQDAVCGIDTPGVGADDTSGGGETDAGATDGGGEDVSTEPDVVIPPLQPITKITWTLNGIEQDFDLNASAFFIDVDSLLKISAAGKGVKGVKKIEINIAPVEATTVGNFNPDDIASEVVATICYLDGDLESNPPISVPGCGGDAGGFNWASTLYDVTIEENNGKDSYVKGTFTGTLQNAFGDELVFENGQLNVLFK